MIEIIDISSKQRTEPDKSFGFFRFPEYPRIETDDILFAYCSGLCSQGEKANYVITYTAEVYRVSVFEFGVDEFMERVCPFLKNWDYDTMPDLKYFLNPDERFTFKRNDWCWLGLWGAHSLYMHASMTEDFANATKGFSHSDMSQKWLDVAVGLIRKMIEDINPIKKKLMFVANKHIITDRAEIEKHVHTEVWNKTVSKYQEFCSVLIEIPADELEKWLDSYSEGITQICKNALTPFQERADEISYIYIEYGGEPKWLRRFAEDEGSWYEMLCDEVLPSWMSRETKWDYYPSIEDALDSESTKQGLHIYVTLCFDK